MFDLSSSIPAYEISDLIAIILLGAFGGLLGSLYNFLIGMTLRTYSIINEYVLTIDIMLILLHCSTLNYILNFDLLSWTCNDISF